MQAKAAHDAARDSGERIQLQDPVVLGGLTELRQAIINWSIHDHNEYRLMSLQWSRDATPTGVLASGA